MQKKNYLLQKAFWCLKNICWRIFFSSERLNEGVTFSYHLKQGFFLRKQSKSSEKKLGTSENEKI